MAALPPPALHRQRPSLSIAMPPSIVVSPHNNELPRTPVQTDTNPQMVKEPPPPPRQTFRVRRRRGTVTLQEQDILNENSIIPTIEMSEATSELSSPMLHPVSGNEGLLSPLHIHRYGTEPKTPAPRLASGFTSPCGTPANEWSLINDSRDSQRYERAGSVCSSFSDSSISSCGSSAFSAPNGGSCASPDSDATDPFVDDHSPKNSADVLITSPNCGDSPQAKRVKTSRSVKWTSAMDHHLWMTYMQYISDPRLTPFKMLPGTAPPLGVCSRVATKAKRTWSQHRAISPLIGGPSRPENTNESEDALREGTPDTIRPEQEGRQPQWPRSEGATRRRLKELCKRKPSLHAHYQRLLRTRSPSPFTSSSSTPQPRGSETGPALSFSSRDLNVSLAAATAPSMQPEGPLARLANNEDPPRPQSQREARPADWFARIGRSQAHQKSLSLHSGLALASFTSSAQQTSAFDVDRAHLLQSMTATRSLGRAEFPKNGKVPSLEAPLELSASTLPRSLKRRFKSDEEKPKRPTISGIFEGGDETIIVRNRGFTVGAVRATDTLARLFEPRTPGQDHIMEEAPTTVATPAATVDADPFRCDSFPMLTSGTNSAPRILAEPVPRLGSPFVETQSTRQHNTFPRSYVPSAHNPHPFQRRLREIVGDDFLPRAN